MVPLTPDQRVRWVVVVVEDRMSGREVGRMGSFVGSCVRLSFKVDVGPGGLGGCRKVGTRQTGEIG